jgi:hypothetical protein
LGDNAGPSKLQAIKKHNLPTINEDEFLNLIATRVGPQGGGNVDEKMRKKLEKEENAIKQAVKELEKREKKAAKTQEGRFVRLPLVHYFVLIYTVAVLRLIRILNYGQSDMHLNRSKKL